VLFKMKKRKGTIPASYTVTLSELQI